ncbi:MAG: glycogen-binding domain-containing protein [Lentisphaeria bacterium]|nr:glycogen-binding domain-containing protein [Lentisphaeria bacterium]MBR2912187.1 glycogen-binding domain-containing protein [Lentisphaeria bacterium]
MGKKMTEKRKAVSGYRIIRLTCETAPGRKVFVAGSFNDWKAEKELVDKDNSGVYRCQLRLMPGEYQYKFVVDGCWCLDAENPNFVPNDFGTLNSLLVVREKEL